MLVKCKTCGNKIEKGDSYCYLHKTKSGKIQKRYYCSREHFHEPYIDNVYYNRTRRLVDKILGYVCISNEKNKMITRLYDVGYSRKDVLECMKYYKDDIIKYMELKNIQNEYGKLRYVFTVVENNIKDFSTREIDAPVMQEEVKIEEEPVYVPIKTHKRRSLKDRLKEG